MIGMNTPTLPPAVPSDAALTYALTLLAIASDPAGTKSRLDELVARITAVHAAVAEHEVAAKTAQDAAAALAGLEQRAQEMADRENSLIKAQTQLNVASGALASRDEALKSREATHALREDDLAKRIAELDRRVESYRAALA